MMLALASISTCSVVSIMSEVGAPTRLSPVCKRRVTVGDTACMIISQRA
jgi:hypothetical protein